MTAKASLAAWDSKRIGQRIRWAREIGWPSRSEFARELGVDVATIRNIEMGTRNPSVPLLRLICHALRITWAYVMDGKPGGEDYDPVLIGEIFRRHSVELSIPMQASPPDNPRSRSGKVRAAGSL